MIHTFGALDLQHSVGFAPRALARYDGGLEGRRTFRHLPPRFSVSVPPLTACVAGR